MCKIAYFTRWRRKKVRDGFRRAVASCLSRRHCRCRRRRSFFASQVLVFCVLSCTCRIIDEMRAFNECVEKFLNLNGNLTTQWQQPAIQATNRMYQDWEIDCAL